MANQNAQSFAGAARPVQGGKRVIGVWDLICWAFQRERATLDFGEEATGIQTRLAVDPIYRMVENGLLGCRVDGGGTTPRHHDADIVAATVTVLPEGCGGRAMAIWIADLARAGRTPDWFPDGQPRVLPLETTTNQHGPRARTEDAVKLRDQGWPHQPRRNRKGKVVWDKVLYCPCVIRPSIAEIGRARRAYLDWWRALFDIRQALRTNTHLTAYEVSDAMPPRNPWVKTA